MNRKEFLKNSTENYRTYYGQYVNESVKTLVYKYIGTRRLLKSKDQDLNDIPLHLWETINLGYVPASIIEKTKKLGEIPSISSLVYVYKEAAQQIIEYLHNDPYNLDDPAPK